MKKERLRGVNLGGWFSQVDCIQEKDPVGFPGLLPHIESFLGVSDFRRIREAGFNHVRLPVDYFNLFEGDELKPNGAVFALLDKALREAMENAPWTDCTDFESTMYPSLVSLEHFANRPDDRPFFVCEYAHSMGNSPGNPTGSFSWMQST